MNAEDWDALAAEAAAMRPPNRRTEAVLGALELGLKRSWPHTKRPAEGSWVAILEAPPIGEVWSCSHSHSTQVGGWACGMTAVDVIVRGEDPNDYQWNALDE